MQQMMVPEEDHRGSQVPGTSLPVRQLMHLQLEQQNDLETPVQQSLKDLPKPWHRAFIALHLNKHERLELFQVSRATAAMVVQHCHHLALKPHWTLQQSSSKRRFVLRLAAGCNNISLHMFPSPLNLMLNQDSIVCLDVSAVWPCVKQLTLTSIGLNDITLPILHIRQLANLSTIRVCSKSSDQASIKQLDAAALQHLVQSGGLPALQEVSIVYSSTELNARPVLRQLGAILGHQVIKLTVGRVEEFEVVDSWPALQHVALDQHAHPAQRNVDTSAAIKQLFSHPQLKTLSTCSTLFQHSATTIISSKGLGLLHLTDSSISDEHLLCVPTHAVQHLRLHMPHLTMTSATAAVQHLRKCSNVEVVPHTWSVYRKLPSVGCVDPTTPTVVAQWDPEWLSWLLPTCNQPQGAVALEWNKLSAFAGAGLVSMAKLASLALVPAGMHTLCLEFCMLAGGCAWVDVFAHVPSHIQVLVIKSCGFLETDLRAVLDQDPPAGLKHLHLAHDQKRHGWVGEMSWVFSHAAEVRAVVAVKWPHVTLDVGD